MKFSEYLFESNINDIKKQPNIFISIIGGSASGKNHIHGKYFRGLPLLDLDEETKKLSGGDFELARKMISKANSIIKNKFEKYCENQVSHVIVSTGANYKGVSNRFKFAKENGMQTAVILVDVDLDIALQRNRDRAEKGNQGLIPDWKVEKTNVEARENYRLYAKETDYSLVIKN